ncbi:class I SAM-dependent methyltransferase [Luteimonas sp. R10]|uniref:class I SAM-dependent methyltransferase n=1 Tax=Luteimonas sp. R10 TaxID=3108176 RepID=UPI00308BE091|nr:class I SAM-dependent methyltransferase [Luteimonas sp. R10]
MKLLGKFDRMPALTVKRVVAVVLGALALAAALVAVYMLDTFLLSVSIFLVAIVVAMVAVGTYRRVGHHMAGFAQSAAGIDWTRQRLEQMSHVQARCETMLKQASIQDLRPLVLSAFREIAENNESAATRSQDLADRQQLLSQRVEKLDALIQVVEMRVANLDSVHKQVETRLTDRIGQMRSELERDHRDALGKLGNLQRSLESESLSVRTGMKEALHAISKDMGGQLDKLQELGSGSSIELGDRIGSLHDELVKPVRHIEQEIVGGHLRFAVLNDFNSMASIDRRLELRAAAPAMSGWSIEPISLAQMLEFVERVKPASVLECGSGASTVLLAYALEKVGGRLIALEHLEEYAEATRRDLQRHRLNHVAEVRAAPLEEFELSGGVFRWYARAAWADLRDIDLLLVDGPPKATGKMARYPALPLLAGALSAHATVVLDDMHRPEERQALELWQKEFSAIGVAAPWGERMLQIEWRNTD